MVGTHIYLMPNLLNFGCKVGYMSSNWPVLMMTCLQKRYYNNMLMYML